MTKYDEYMKEYRLARLSAQMIDAKLVKLHIKKLVEEDIRKALTNFQFFYRIDESSKGIKGIMAVDIDVIDPDTRKNLIEAQVAYEGTFVNNTSDISEEEFKEFVEDQIIPQLLPYCRSILAMVSSHLGGKPIELPTMDVIQSMIRNQEDSEKSDE